LFQYRSKLSLFQENYYLKAFLSKKNKLIAGLNYEMAEYFSPRMTFLFSISAGQRNPA